MRFGRHLSAAVLAVATVLCVAAGLAGVGVQAVGASGYRAGAVQPDVDPFYQAPTALSSFGAGAVVRSRAVVATMFGGPLLVTGWQIAYRSNDSHDRPELAVTTLLVPTIKWRGAGLRPVVSVQAMEDSLGTQCAPSYKIARNTDALDLPMVSTLLALGYAVAVPDHEGPKSVFLAGPQEGHAVLDGIRAVQRFGHAGVGTGNQYAIVGYSGGANATAWAAQLQPTYAPDVQLVGAAIGGTPARPASVAEFLDGGPLAGLEFAAAFGIAREWPESGIEKLLNEQGKALWAQLAGKCQEQLLVLGAGKKLGNYTTTAHPLLVPSVQRILSIDTLGRQRPSIPIYDYHAVQDEFVPSAQDDQLVEDWCSKGATVVKVRDVGDHASELALRLPSVLSFLRDRFAGTPMRAGC